MNFTPDRIDSAAKATANQFTFKSQLEADLSTGVRGGNKARLVARCYVATCKAIDPSLAELTNAEAYNEFYKINAKKTFNKLHEEFDAVLPIEYRAK